MNPHLRRGLIAFLIAFGAVAIYGAIDVYLDPPVDVPSVGYWAYGWLVKAILAMGAGFGVIVFAITISGSWLIVNAKKTWVKVGILLFVAILGASIYLIMKQPPPRQPPTIIDELPEGRLK